MIKYLRWERVVSRDRQHLNTFVQNQSHNKNDNNANNSTATTTTNRISLVSITCDINFIGDRTEHTLNENWQIGWHCSSADKLSVNAFNCKLSLIPFEAFVHSNTINHVIHLNSQPNIVHRFSWAKMWSEISSLSWAGPIIIITMVDLMLDFACTFRPWRHWQWLLPLSQTTIETGMQLRKPKIIQIISEPSFAE